MNLLEEPWLPVRRTDGSRAWVAPTALADPTLVAFDADRPDFNGALAQFAIGLLQTTAPVDTNTAWRELFRSPPSVETLAQWFAPVQKAFALDGNGPRFMQDLTLRPDEGAVNDISALLIETPGEQTLKNNADHFIKRGQAEAICPHCAATALLTLQINAPAGGAGHRTGLRGGGPLSTLVTCQPSRSLWHDLWLNVREQPGFLDHSGDRTLTEPGYTFPWLAGITALQKDKGELAPIQAHPTHVFWAMPRRIRLDFEQTQSGICPLCGRMSDQLIRQYVTKNYGLNYKGAWDHPLSPYSQKGDDWLPLHPQPGGIGYRHWLGWVLGAATESNKNMRRARVVSHVLASGRGVIEGQLRLWAFGYNMGNMKARCWYEASLPLYGLNECDVDAQRRVEEGVRQWLAGADEAADVLVGAVKNAWFPIGISKDWSTEKKKKFKADIVSQFWAATEADFYRQLRDLIDLARADGDIDHQAIAQAWLARLRRVAIDLFDTQFVGAGAIERQNPRRAAEAYRQLGRNLAGKKIRAALGLPATAKPSTQPADAVNVQP